ncbi:G-protein coupled receptor 35-like [Notolabrus celidotus]|uniref:G-protein coupled receptor 35-like n=1 Tax=Notolabrus celidotus TaxID=1203425 RepID=UPI001490269B|nr:G-protein coupled receptor 35-like [Notolabrus celidotus]
MANNSSANLSPASYLYGIIGSADHIISIPVNCWSVWLIASGNKNLFESEFLTLHLVSLELGFSLCFFLSLPCILFKYRFLVPLIDFYHGGSAAGRALFQCHICVDRYMAVVHPLLFIRYKKIRYRGACLAAVWLLVLLFGLSSRFMPMDTDLVTTGLSFLLAPALSIELFCSLSILRILKRFGPGDKKACEKKGGSKQKMRAMKIICLALAMLIVNMAPFLTLSLFINHGEPVDMITIAFIISSLGSSAQAFLFLNRAGKLKS